MSATSASGSSSVARARDVRAFLRARRRRARPTAYQVYAAVLVAAILGVLVEHAAASIVGGGVSSRALAQIGPVAALLIVLAALRFGTWQGPVSFSAPDVGLLLSAPIATAVLVRPKLDHGLLLGALAGAAAGATVLLVTGGGPAALGPGRAVGGVVAVAALGVLAVAASWLVQSSRRAVGPVRRAGLVVILIAAALIAAGVTAAGRGVEAWSGPWGWAIAPFTAVSGWPLAVALALASAALTAAWARRRAGAASAEAFLARAETRSGLGASAFLLDYRAAALTYRAARPTGVARPLRVALPSRARWVVLWRDATALTRDRARTGWAALIAAAATVEALTHPGRLLAAGLMAVGLYVAASLLCEPLRVDVDDPQRGALLLSWPFARVLVAHCVLPILVLGSVVTATIAVAVAVGAVGVGALLVIAALGLPAVAVAVLCAALAARRGGRVDENLLARILSQDPSNPAGAVLVVLWLAPWLIAAVIVIGGAADLLGSAVAHHRSALGPGALAAVIACAAVAALAAAARRSPRPQ